MQYEVPLRKTLPRIRFRITSVTTLLQKTRNVSYPLELKNNILKFIRPSPSNVFNCNNYKGIRLITWLRVGMSQLREHKFKHNFEDCLNPICSCGADIKSTSHFLLHCPTFNVLLYLLLLLILSLFFIYSKAF